MLCILTNVWPAVAKTQNQPCCLWPLPHGIQLFTLVPHHVLNLQPWAYFADCHGDVVQQHLSLLQKPFSVGRGCSSVVTIFAQRVVQSLLLPTPGIVVCAHNSRTLRHNQEGQMVKAILSYINKFKMEFRSFILKCQLPLRVVFWFVLCLLSPALHSLSLWCLPETVYPCRWHALPGLRKCQELGRQPETFLKVCGCPLPRCSWFVILLLTFGCEMAQGKIVSSQQLSVYWKSGDSNWTPEFVSLEFERMKWVFGWLGLRNLWLENEKHTST